MGHSTNMGVVIGVVDGTLQGKYSVAGWWGSLA